MIKTVLFDLDDTLYAFPPADQTGRNAVRDYAERVVGVDGKAFMDCFQEMLLLQSRLHGDSAGCHSRAIRCQLVCEKMGISIRHAAVMNDIFWNTYLDSISPFPGIPELFAAIRANGMKIGICTNMTADWQLKKLAKLGLADLCDFLVSSEEAAAEKPDRAIFELCREKAGCRAEECLFIGDNPTCDIQGALDAGMQGRWLVHKPEALARHPGLPFVTAPDQIAARIGLELPAGL